MSDKTIFQIPATLTSIKSRLTKDWVLKFETQENIPNERIAVLIELNGKTGWLNFASDLIEITDLKDLAKIDPAKYEGKTPAQRLRAVLFLRHKQLGGKDRDFEDFYRKSVEHFISQVKEKLE